MTTDDEEPGLAQANDFLSLISLERLDDGVFVNRFSDMDFQGGHMFGGQLVAQALAAAIATTEDRLVQSLHGYFLRPGNVRAPVLFEVEITRDGRSFSSRRVVARQEGKPLLDLLCSAGTGEAGALDHQRAMPGNVARPEDLASMAELREMAEFDDCAEAIERLSPMKLIDVRPLDPAHLFRPGSGGDARVWLRVPTAPADMDVNKQACMLAYMADYWIAYAPWTRQSRPFTWNGPSVASLDANTWFHRPVRGGEWLLYDLPSPSGAGAIGFTMCHLYDRQGCLVASAAQEVLYRQG